MRVFIILSAAIFCFTNALSLNKALKEEKCGIPAIKPDTSSNIVGGKDSIPHSWPWQVFLGGCGGSLITNEWVMTAAHCIGSTNPKGYTVRLGVFNRTNTRESGQLSSKISEVHVHPLYKKNNKNSWNDIALMKLEKPIEFTDFISPVCLPTVADELPPAETNTFIIGWGNTRVPSSTPSATLKQVLVPLVSPAKCKAANPSNFEFNEKYEICVGFDQGGKGACHGDSGGPALILNPDGSWTQVGIASWVHAGQCASKAYTVYSKVSAFLEFIRQYVKEF